MNQAEYHRATQLLSARGVSVQDQEYSERRFGSWYFVASTQPPRRLVWDGKERRLLVEEQTAEQFNGLPVWRELWHECNTRPESIELALNALCSEWQPPSNAP